MEWFLEFFQQQGRDGIISIAVAALVTLLAIITMDRLDALGAVFVFVSSLVIVFVCLLAWRRLRRVRARDGLRGTDDGETNN